MAIFWIMLGFAVSTLLVSISRGLSDVWMRAFGAMLFGPFALIGALFDEPQNERKTDPDQKQFEKRLGGIFLLCWLLCAIGMGASTKATGLQAIGGGFFLAVVFTGWGMVGYPLIAEAFKTKK